MLAIGAVALSAVIAVICLICRASDRRQAQQEKIEHVLCDYIRRDIADAVTVDNLEAEARADALCREAAK